MKKNFFLYLSPSVLTGLAGVLIIIPLTTYYLDPRDFGVVGIITAFSSLLAPCSSTGLSWVLSGNYYKLDTEGKAELIFNLLWFGIVLRIVWVLGFAAAGFIGLPRLIKSFEPVYFSYFFIFLIAECMNYIWQVVAYVIMLQKKAQAHALLDIVKLACHIIALVVCLAVFHLKAAALVLGYLAIGIGGALFSLIYIHTYMTCKFRKKWIKEIIYRGLPAMPLNLLEIGMNSLGRILVERWLGLASLGIYSHSLDYRKAFMLPQRAFFKTCSPVFLEGFSHKRQRDLAMAKQALRVWFGLTLLAGLVISLFARDILQVLTHGKFIAAAPLVSLWAALMLVYTFGIPYSRFLLAHKKNKFIFHSGLLIGIFSLGLIALGVKLWGIFGATIAVFLYFFILYVAQKIYALKLGCESFEGSYFILALAMIFGCTLLVSTTALSFAVRTGLLTVLVIFVIRYYRLPNLTSLLRMFVQGKVRA